MKIISINCSFLFLIVGFVNGQNTMDSVLHKQIIKDGSTQVIDSITKFNQRVSTLKNITSDLEKQVHSLSIIGNTPKENIWKRSIPNIIGGFIGVGSALLTFYLVMRKENNKEIERYKKGLNEKNNYLGSLLQSALKIAKQQNQGVKELYEKIDTNALNIPLIAIIPKQDLERLSKVIDNEEYYHAFLNTYGSEVENVSLYRNIAGSVDFVTTIISQMFEVQKKGQEFDHQRKMKYKQLFENIRDYTSELGVRNQRANPQLYVFITGVFINYNDVLNNTFDLEYHQNNLIVRLEEGFLQDFGTVTELRQVLNDLKNITLMYSEIKVHNEIHGKDFKEFHKKIEKVIAVLETDGKELIKGFEK
jgi:hypothetical protein